VVVDRLREEGLKVGLLKPRVFRPFPGSELIDALKHLKAIAVMDRSISFGSMNDAGPLFLELAAAFQIHGAKVPMVDYVFGLGGRDIAPAQIDSVYRDLMDIAQDGQPKQLVTYLGVR
jgi:pyruvate ferredoxin oxidoreductase alpha subunit